MTQVQPFIGILMLDTDFKRIPGDVGHPGTFKYPVSYKIIKGATVARIVQSERPDEKLVNGFIAAARELEAAGAIGLISSCGFLSVLQDEIAKSVKIPVILSALNLIPLMHLSLGHKSVGVITADETQLSKQALGAVNVEPGSICMAGMQSSKAFAEFVLTSGVQTPDKETLSRDLIETARTLLKRNPAISIWVLECTNLQPYAARLKAELGLPVLGIVNAANLLWDCSKVRDYIEE